MRRKIIVSFLLAFALLAVGVGVLALFIHHRAAPPEVPRERPPLLVHGEKVKLETLPEPFVGYGAAKAELEAQISAQVPGQVVELADDLKAGASFQAGDLLVRIEDSDYREQLKKAQNLLAADEATLAQLDLQEENLDALIAIARAELEIAESDFRRVRGLREADQAATREYDLAAMAWHGARRQLQTLENDRALVGPSREAALANKHAHEADVELAQIALERCRVTAPFSGRIVIRIVERGEQVAPGQPLLSMLDPRWVEVPIQLPASAYSRVSVGAPTRLSIDSVPGVAWTGRVARVSPAVDSNMRTFDVYVEVDNADQRVALVPGSFVRADVEGALLHDVLVIPRGAIRDEQVFVAEAKGPDGMMVARSRSVTVERTLLERAVVRGIEPGETVITSNPNAVFDGAPIQVIDGRLAAGEAERTGAEPPASVDLAVER